MVNVTHCNGRLSNSCKVTERKHGVASVLSKRKREETICIYFMCENILNNTM